MEVIKDDDSLLKDIIHYTMTRDEHTAIELVIRPECNQQCAYCYLYQHGKESYPKRFSKEQIASNIEKIFDYFIKQDYKIKKIDLFAGDMFYDNLFFEIMPPIIKYFTWLKENHYDFIHKHNLTPGSENPAVIIPCNMSFCEDDEKIQKVRVIHNTLKDLGIKLFFSYSTDGRYSTDIREKKYIPDEFFDKVFKVCEEFDWGVHPMISYEGINQIYNNYDWFKLKMQQYRLNSGNKIPYFLEVRNEGWSDEALGKYAEFLRYYLDNLFHEFNDSDVETFFNKELRTLKKDEKINKYTPVEGPSGLGSLLIKKEHFVPCNLGILNLTINAGDLSLLPCHRLAYPELRGGNFVIENNEITGIKASSYYNAYLNLLFFNNDYKPGCATCDYQQFCIKGCVGSQYEVFGDPSIPIPNVCKLLKTKMNTIIDYYHSIGLFHYLFTTEPEYPANANYQKILLKLGYTEYENYSNLGDLNQ